MMPLPVPAEHMYLNCIRCGACLPVCPTYREKLDEAASPRGRVALARKEIEGELAASGNLRRQMDMCFGCMACNDVCPVGIRPSELILAMRSIHEQQQPAQWKQALFGGLLSEPGRMELATLPLRIHEHLGVRRLACGRWIKSRMPAKLRDLESMLPPIPRRPLRGLIPERREPGGHERYRVGFFLGCAQSLLFAGQSGATLRVLGRNGCTVITPAGTVCCGMPALGYGRPDLAIRQAKHNIASFEAASAEFIITDCATCGSTLKGYGRLLADEIGWERRGAEFSGKVRDVSEFLACIPIEQPDRPIEMRVTYHDPCHLRRGQGVWRQPRELLRRVRGLELVELDESDACCGSAGSQLITHYEMSVRVLDRKAQNLRSTGAQVVACGCPGCQMQLRVGIQRHALDMKVMHPIELLDRAYRQ